VTIECEAALEDASNIDWFSRVGLFLPDFSGERIASWEQWPGPDSPTVEQLAVDLQSIKDDLERQDPDLMKDWDHCLAKVVAKISASVPDWSADEDAWHSPTSAVWHGAWVSVLQSALVRSRRPVPTMLADQIAWFARGHWPAAYSPTPVSVASSRKSYVIF